jgi:hypothetical protein
MAPFDWEIGAGVIACAEVATATTKPAAAINLIIVFLLLYLGLCNLSVEAPNGGKGNA